MPKGNHHHNPKKPEFADYTLAGDQSKALALRETYEVDRAYIRTTRSLRRMCKETCTDPRVSNQTKIRNGYPRDREGTRDHNAPSKRSVPFVNHLHRFKLVEVADAIKVYVLHATRGWKRYA